MNILDKSIEIIYSFVLIPILTYLWNNSLFLKFIALCALGLGYYIIHLLKENSKLKHKCNKAIFDHDLKIFNDSNELLCEEILMEYLSCLYPGTSSLHYSSNVHLFLYKFEEVGNEYLNSALNSAFKDYYNKLKKLSGDVGCNFFPNGANNYVFHPEYRNDEKDHDLYMEMLGKIRTLSDEVRKSYITYRKMIKQHLFV